MSIRPRPLSRRSFLAHGGVALGAAAGLHCRVAGAWADPATAEKGLLVHTETPRNAEPRLAQLVRSWVTPNQQFYIRSHAPVPEVDLDSFRLSVEGLVRRPLQLSMAELRRQFGSHSVFATLTCAGNRRSEHSLVKPVDGVPWQAGAIGNARWTGPRLSDVLRKAELMPGAKHVWFEGVDQIQRDSGVIPFGASIPIDKAINDSVTAPGALLAYEMNDVPLPPDHGYPLRTVVPGYIGARSVKWLGKIVVSDRPSDNHYVATAYKLVTESTPQQWEAAPPLGTYPINAVTCLPAAGATVQPGRLEVRGYALPDGEGRRLIKSVEVSTDGGASWVRAALDSPRQAHCWQLWSAGVTVSPQTSSLLVRATDTGGAVQPERIDWNLKGYMFNAWHQTKLSVKS